MKIKVSAEKIVQDFGITSPEELCVEAIALTLGAKVKIRPLKGCEARIVGKDDKAIISVDSSSTEQRRRFSIGHELGHWQRHRGQNFQCMKEDIGSHYKNSKIKEREADAFSADLLMPWFMFKPMAKKFSHANFDAVFELSERFKTSLAATAIRFVESNVFPSILICYGQTKRQWFTRSRDIPSRWFPQDSLSPESSAFAIAYGRVGRDQCQSKSCASVWFDRREAEKYDILEQSIPYGGGQVLTLLEFIEDNMLEDEEYDERPKGMDDFHWR